MVSLRNRVCDELLGDNVVEGLDRQGATRPVATASSMGIEKGLLERSDPANPGADVAFPHSRIEAAVVASRSFSHVRQAGVAGA